VFGGPRAVAYVLKFNNNNIFLGNNHNEIAPSLEVTIFPNPAKGLINITFKQEVRGSVLVEVINLLGATVYTKNATTSHITIDSSELSQGVYIVKVKSNDSSITKKVVIQ